VTDLAGGSRRRTLWRPWRLRSRRRSRRELR